MPVNIKYLEAFVEGEYFHVIAKAVGGNVLFRNDENKIYFLNQYFHYLYPYVETYAFCLLDNHVHWLVKCKKEKELFDSINQIDKPNRKKHQEYFLDGKINFERELEYQWKDFFISYAMAYNTRYNRKGTLFVNPFRRIAVKDESHLHHLIIYIHANQIKHGLKNTIDKCTFTSYQTLLSTKPTRLRRQEVLDLFIDEKNFKLDHQNAIEHYYVNPFNME